MFPGTAQTHIGILFFVFFVALLLNSTPSFLTGISPAYRQSSDATVHLVQWQQFSENYTGNFDTDVMFQNYPGQPTGTLYVGKALVRVAEFLNISLLDWSIIVSVLSLILFLSGVYFLVLYSTKSPFLGLLITLVSIIPVISLGLSGWGFLVIGFVPKEISVGISVWITILYLYGASTGSKKHIAFVFAFLGLFANWYPPVFFHYALVLITVEVIRARAIRKEHVIYGLLFLVTTPLALYDIFIKAAAFAPPVLSIIIDHYGAPLQSLSYLLIHYVRKQIIYIILVGTLWYLYRQVLGKGYPPLMQIWYAIWWSTLVWSLVGVGIEVFFPLYMKYLISRISVWFYLASMVIVAYTAYEIWRAKFGADTKKKIIFGALLVAILFSQTSILSTYTGIRKYVADAEDYKQYLSVATKLQSIVPHSSLVLANPDTRANTLRTYGGVGIWVSAKDGNVTLFDGAAAQLWYDRYKEAQKVFATKDFSAIRTYAATHGIQYYFFNKKDTLKDEDLIGEDVLLESGNYGLIKF